MAPSDISPATESFMYRFIWRFQTRKIGIAANMKSEEEIRVVWVYVDARTSFVEKHVPGELGCQ